MGLASLVAGVLGAALFLVDARVVSTGPAFWPLMVLAGLLLVAAIAAGIYAIAHGQRATGLLGAAFSALWLILLLHPFLMRD
jgi:hypothetical protein